MRYLQRFRVFAFCAAVLLPLGRAEATFTPEADMQDRQYVPIYVMHGQVFRADVGTADYEVEVYFNPRKKTLRWQSVLTIYSLIGGLQVAVPYRANGERVARPNPADFHSSIAIVTADPVESFRCEKNASVIAGEIRQAAWQAGYQPEFTIGSPFGVKDENASIQFMVRENRFIGIYIRDILHADEATACVILSGKGLQLEPALIRSLPEDVPIISMSLPLLTQGVGIKLSTNPKKPAGEKGRVLRLHSRTNTKAGM